MRRAGYILGFTAVFLAVAEMLPISAHSGDSTVKAVMDTFSSRIEAYGRVEPVSLLRLKATATGVVTGLSALPGEEVRAGMVLAVLKGPAMEELLTELGKELAAAEFAEATALKTLEIERRKEAERLATSKDVLQAEADLSRKRAELEIAGARLRAAQAESVLKSPVPARVLSIDVAEGESAQPGQTVLTLQPLGALWLKAMVYGAEAGAVRKGMKGTFFPADGSPGIPVRIRSVIGTIQPDGGLSLGLTATVSEPGWRSGEAGTVLLEGPKRTLPSVPTRALILDRGKWWVLVRTKQGDRRRQVVPGPSRGDSTFIERGLEPGTEVVVEKAYLEFHRDFSEHYEAPD